MSGLLEGMRVVDLSRVLAGPYCAQILAEMGADVVKVEPPGGDVARAIGPYVDGRSLYFSSLNTDKRSVVLDLTTGEGFRGLDALLAASDIVVENYRPAAAGKLGLTADELMARHPGLVVVTISAYARGSDREDDGGFDLVAQAESGIMALTGEPGGTPMRAGVAISDLAAGLWGALGACAAHAAVLRGQEPRHVEVPLLDASMSLLTYMATTAMGTGVEPDPVGSGHPNIVPYRAFAARDGWVVIAAVGDKFWRGLCDALGLDELAGRADLATNPGRTAAQPEVDEAVAVAIGALTTAEALDRLRSAGVPHAPINTLLEAVATPYVRATGMVADVPAPWGTYRVVQGPLRSGLPPRPAPNVGEHTAEVMTEILGGDSPDLRPILEAAEPAAG